MKLRAPGPGPAGEQEALRQGRKEGDRFPGGLLLGGLRAVLPDTRRRGGEGIGFRGGGGLVLRYRGGLRRTAEAGFRFVCGGDEGVLVEVLYEHLPLSLLLPIPEAPQPQHHQGTAGGEGRIALPAEEDGFPLGPLRGGAHLSHDGGGQALRRGGLPADKGVVDGDLVVEICLTGGAGGHVLHEPLPVRLRQYAVYECADEVLVFFAGSQGRLAPLPDCSVSLDGRYPDKFPSSRRILRRAFLAREMRLFTVPRSRLSAPAISS